MFKYLDEDLDYFGYLPEQNIACPFCNHYTLVTIGIDFAYETKSLLCYNCERKFKIAEDLDMHNIHKICQAIKANEGKDVTV